MPVVQKALDNSGLKKEDLFAVEVCRFRRWRETLHALSRISEKCCMECEAPPADVFTHVVPAGR